ncbi:hypothetical protein Shew185_0309 [Shewanella baltica OS185]|nr:hypothetical protein Shew185_0309 [Shewanella baltica OS185]
MRLWSENHYAFKPPPCLNRFELPLNEQIFNTIGITTKLHISSIAQSIDMPMTK